MIAVPVYGEIRPVVVAAPSHFARQEKPCHPQGVDHQCIDWHATESSPPYRWEFTENGRDFAVDVRACILTNQPALNVRLAAAGAGITLSDDRRARVYVDRGELISLLEEFLTVPGVYLYLYCPQRRQASAPLRALVDHLRASHSARRKGVEKARRSTMQ